MWTHLKCAAQYHSHLDDLLNFLISFGPSLIHEKFNRKYFEELFQNFQIKKWYSDRNLVNPLFMYLSMSILDMLTVTQYSLTHPPYPRYCLGRSLGIKLTKCVSFNVNVPLLDSIKFLLGILVEASALYLRTDHYEGTLYKFFFFFFLQ